MSEENKTVELKEEDLEKVSGGSIGGVNLTMTAGAGYYRNKNYSSIICYLASDVTNRASSYVYLKEYCLDQTSGNYVLFNSNLKLTLYALCNCYAKMDDVSSITFAE